MDSHEANTDYGRSTVIQGFPPSWEGLLRSPTANVDNDVSWKIRSQSRDPRVATLSASSTTQIESPRTNPQPLGPGGSWALRFSDGFKGSSLDLSKWNNTWYVVGGVQNNVATYASNVSVANGELRLKLAKRNGNITGASVKTQGNNGYALPVGG